MKTFRDRFRLVLLAAASSFAASFASAAPVSVEQVADVPHPFVAPVPVLPVPQAKSVEEPRSVPINVAALLTNKDDGESVAPPAVSLDTTVIDTTAPPQLSPRPANAQKQKPKSAPEVVIAPPQVVPWNQQLTANPDTRKTAYRRPVSHTVSHTGTHMLNRYFCDECGLLTCENKRQFGFFFDGWLDHGVSLNGQNVGTDNSPLRFTDMANEYALNQLYLTFGREVRKGDRLSAGFRVDVLYGSDYFWTSATGLETQTYSTLDAPPFGSVRVPTLDPHTADGRWNIGSGQRGEFGNRYRYGLSLPQFYGEAYLPVGHGTTIKAGHFYSDFGLESAMAPENTFYSHSYSFMYGSPVTVSGGTVTQKLGRRLSVTAGITRGWDTWDNVTGDLSFLVGAAWKRPETGTRLSWMLMSGRTEYSNKNPRTHYVLTLQQQLSQNVRFGLEHTLGWEKDGSLFNTDGDRRDSNWASVAGVLEMQISQRLSSNFRAEWFRDGGYAHVNGMTPIDTDETISGNDYFALTYGLRWQPHRIVTIRPEVRYDWSNVRRQSPTEGTAGPFSGKDHLFTTSLDMILRF
ncbi:MAG: outer membrane beta-barrel protein [Thermoguttaceae bacterium]